MQRDMDLIREILLCIEAHASPDKWLEISIEGRSEEEISYHVKLLTQAGLVEARDVSTIGEFSWKPTSLTWEGHEFIEAARDEAMWERAKRLMIDRGGGLSFEVLKAVLIDLVKTSVIGT